MSDNIIVATGDNFAASLFQPDTLISLQSENFRRKTPLESEKKLMLAILADAVWCFQANVWARNGKGKKLFGETEKWILDESSDWFFPSRVSVRFWRLVLGTYARGSCNGKKRD